MKQQVLWRVAADAEFRKDNEVSLQVVPGACRIVENTCAIASDITYDQIELGERDSDCVVHRSMPCG